MVKKQPKTGFFSCKKYFLPQKKNWMEGNAHQNHFTFLLRRVIFFSGARCNYIYVYIAPCTDVNSYFQQFRPKFNNIDL